MKQLGAIALALSAAATTVSAAEYQVDPAHTTVQFVIGHLGISQTVGRFNAFSGSYNIDEQEPSKVSVEFKIDTTSIDSNHEKRDQHLRSPDFLDVKQFPEMHFKSTAYEGNGEQGVLKGDLTLRGETRPVEFAIVKVGEGKDPWGGYRSGFNATATINRSDFGVTYFIPGVTDETQIQLFVEGIRQ